MLSATSFRKDHPCKLISPTIPFTFHSNGYDIHLRYGSTQPVVESVSFYGDFLKTCNKSLAFLNDPKFIKAYERGMEAPRKAKPDIANNLDLRYRFHTCIWAAKHASKLEGDFVECGVNLGALSMGVCEYLDFNKIDKSFYLFDTYEGIPESHVSAEENINEIKAYNQSMYFECYEMVQEIFKPFKKAQLVRGTVPETLTDVEIDKVAYLSIDMNLAKTEVAAMEFFWDKLVPGAVVVFDDYGWAAHKAQQVALDAFAKERNHAIMTLPTGQGLLIKI